MASEDRGREYLTTADAARLLRVSPGTVHRWAREGRIPTVTIDGRRRFRREDLEAVARGMNNHH
jgi:excisionase family DNA binding protein